MVVKQKLAEIIVFQFFSIRAAELVSEAIREKVQFIIRKQIQFFIGKFIILLSQKISDRLFITTNFYHFIIADDE